MFTHYWLRFFLSILSENAQSQWIQCNRPYGGEIRNLAASGGIIYAGTYQYGILVSTDNGLTWNKTGLNNKNIFSIFINGNYVFSVTNQGIWVSTNNGLNWIQSSIVTKIFFRFLQAETTSLQKQNQVSGFQQITETTGPKQH